VTPSTAIGLSLALPLLASILVALFGRRPNLRDGCTLLLGVLLLVTVASLLPEVRPGRPEPSLSLFEVIPGLALAFRVEPLGMLFSLVAAGLWIVTTVYSVGYMRGHHEKHQTRFFACFAIAIFAAIGAAYSANLFTLFLFYEVLTLSTYPLVTHHQTEQAKAGGRVYLGILLTTSICFLLLAIVWTWVLTGTLDFRPGGILRDAGLSKPMLMVLLGLFAFGTGKAALMPFHRWLPAAMVAPTPVSALLHAVAVVKVGVFTILKIAVYIFGIDLLSTGISTWLMYVAGFTILAASLVAMTKDNLKARLAYSTVSQLGYIVLGAALATQWSVVGGGMHIAMHAFGKITLFFCAGAIYVAANKTDISDMDGIGRRMPFTMLAFLLGSLSVIGLPPFGGSWSKWYLAFGAAEAHQRIFIAVLMASALLNIWYLIPVVARGFFLPPRDGERGIKEAPLLCVAPLCFTALGGIVLFFFADEIYRLLLPMAQP